MKVISINTVPNVSTGHIMHDTQVCASNKGYDTLALVGRREPYLDVPCEKFGNYVSFWLHVIWTTMTDRHGFGSKLQTKRLIERLRQEQPDIIHLHNLHGYYVHLPTLFSYLKNEYTGRVVWTFHDLWPISGHCAYFTAAKCDKWKVGCNNCPNKHRYPVSLGLDSSRKNYNDKKNLFTGIKYMIITTPSMWMKDIVEQSYMSEYPVMYVTNGVDVDVFDYHRELSSELLDKYKLPKDKKILLSVASIWDERKGLKDLAALSEILPPEYVIVVVGLSDKQIKKLPVGMVGLRRTECVDELVALYSKADIFLNPSMEESFSLVTVESHACGTPTIVLDTSAVAELVCSNNGVVLHEHTAQDYLNAIHSIEDERLDREKVRQTAMTHTKQQMTEGMMQVYEM